MKYNSENVSLTIEKILKTVPSGKKIEHGEWLIHYCNVTKINKDATLHSFTSLCGVRKDQMVNSLQAIIHLYLQGDFDRRTIYDMVSFSFALQNEPEINILVNYSKN